MMDTRDSLTRLGDDIWGEEACPFPCSSDGHTVKALCPSLVHIDYQLEKIIHRSSRCVPLFVSCITAVTTLVRRLRPG